MADGDITAIKELGRLTIPGGGREVGGTPSNDKIIAWGRITATYAAAGISLIGAGGFRALGVKGTGDLISLQVRYCGTTATTVPTDNNLFLANLQAKTETGKIFICDQVGQANPAVPTPGEDVTIDYLVVGEDARHLDHG
jgi:hypothetical protein